MSDEKHDDADKKGDKKDAAKAAAPAAGGIKALMGPILAVIILVGAGVGVGLFLAKFFAKAPETAGTKTAGHGEAPHGGETEGEHGGAHASLLHSAKELVIEDVVANIKEQGGKRFVKIVPAFWVTTEAASAIGLDGGGHGGEAGGEIKRIIKARIEENLKQYDLEELTSQSIYKRLEKNLKDLVDKEIKAFAPELPSTKPVVLKVVLSGLVVQ